MKIINSPAELKENIRSYKNSRQIIGLVPSMGYFHNGHLSLMKEARKRSEKVVVSLFVNPIQFGENEDLSSYPRDLERDCNLAESQGVDLIFCPDAEDMYPLPFSTTVDVSGLTENLCGASRPGHFRGVTTVVAKLFNLVQPDIAFFGEKDFQQLTVIKQMVKDLNFPIDIIGCPIIREDDGLAMSSRNVYLNAEEREAALTLSQSLKIARDIVKKEGGRCESLQLIQKVSENITRYKINTIDYVKVVSKQTLEEMETANSESMLVMAVKINNRVRLIDNCSLDAGVSR